jgi:PD-(D/E)XK endonuclease
MVFMEHDFSTPTIGGVSFLRDTKTIGELSELIVALHLAQAGYFVAKPFGENQRHDLIIDDGQTLSRVQVKTGRLRNGVIRFNTYSTHRHRKGVACKPYTNQIDFFGVYCPALDSAYLVPIGDTAPLSGSLRVRATKNGQYSHVRWAHRYLIGGEPAPELLVVGSRAADGVTEPGPRPPS